MDPTTDPAFSVALDETALTTQSILLAAAHHDIPALRDLLRNTSANVQDAETGFTPLHAAIAACEPYEEGGPKPTNGHTNDDEESEERKNELDAAARTVKFLFQNGAIWNDLDSKNETPGCVARRLGLSEMYEIVVDAGVRAELLLARLDQYQILGDQGDSEEEEEEEEDDGKEVQSAEAVVEVEDQTNGEDVSTTNPNYLASQLTFTETRILDDSANGVMMAWETTLMKRSAELLLPSSGLRVLNIGHGMGIIDGIFQSLNPSAHHVVEAHPDVLKRMKEEGWYEKPGLVVHEGRWQDVVPALVEKGEIFDAIYFDTFAEEYKALKEFFTEHVIGLLAPKEGSGEGGRFGFFNGMGADRQVCYDVYHKIVEMELFEAGFDVEWEEIAVPDLQDSGEWEGVKRSYWALDKYRLPTCTFIG
ncbi:arginine N-methyltransferas-like protein [Mytilinidion resinicola]|uniref:Arginine N-methyltransferase 2 n=1 Tax=Mytilinidion resinicola TaxID=574789 RepID=A0A6A6YI41_9PEZI|nr:arginine N-methyltransferas-like protein [Mytilinidion resinicola]KAF2807587.1 arginine N-methyltransferas-like protein [Mytilinidion resinicola]